MSNDQQQEQPGPEWVVIGGGGGYLHPVLRLMVKAKKVSVGSWISEINNEDEGYTGMDALPAEACRAISAAALEWERMKTAVSIGLNWDEYREFLAWKEAQ